MSQRFAQHLRGNFVAYLALVLAIGGSGGYAIAAANNSTIRGCVVKKTGELLIESRCGRGQAKLTWNEQGVQGKTGAPGVPGQAPPSAWALVSNSGATNPEATNGISVTHVSAGTYQITVTAPACVGKTNAPVVSLSDGNPPGGQTAGAFPVAWVLDSLGGSPFTVYTGDVVSGVFTASDHEFAIQDVCGT